MPIEDRALRCIDKCYAFSYVCMYGWVITVTNSRTCQLRIEHYAVSINVMPFHICTLNSKKLKGKVGQNRILHCFKNLTTIRHGVLV